MPKRNPKHQSSQKKRYKNRNRNKTPLAYPPSMFGEYDPKEIQRSEREWNDLNDEINLSNLDPTSLMILERVLLQRNLSELLETEALQNLILSHTSPLEHVLEESFDPLIFQIKLTLKGSKPPIWRRILIENTTTFEDLHALIMEFFDWSDMHLHEFRFTSPENRNHTTYIGNPSEDAWNYEEIYPEDQIQLGHVFHRLQSRVHYTYDFGDQWECLIKLEEVYDPQTIQKIGLLHSLPICIKAKGAGPPEDIGGIWRYHHYLQIRTNPKTHDEKELVEWVGDDFDPTDIPHEVIAIPSKELKQLPKIPPLIPSEIKPRSQTTMNKATQSPIFSLTPESSIPALHPSLFAQTISQQNSYNWYLYELALSIEEGFQCFRESTIRIKGFRKTEIPSYTVQLLLANRKTLMEPNSDGEISITKPMLRAILPLIPEAAIKDLQLEIKTKVNFFLRHCHTCPSDCVNHKTRSCMLFNEN